MLVILAALKIYQFTIKLYGLNINSDVHVHKKSNTNAVMKVRIIIVEKGLQ